MSTAHNSAQKDQIAKVVLMPGDPLRAKFLAERYLEDAQCFNEVRGMLGFTGTYRGKRISVMGSGMGVPSMGIYSYELFHDYDVDAIIRIGSTGGIAPQVHIRDLVFAQAACTDSNFANHYQLPGVLAPIGDFGLLRAAAEEAERLGVPYHVGNVVTTDVFYRADDAYDRWKAMGVLASEMEVMALYCNAIEAQKKALAIMTVSDHIFTGESLPPEERQTSFTQMMEVALAVAEREAR